MFDRLTVESLLPDDEARMLYRKYGLVAQGRNKLALFLKDTSTKIKRTFVLNFSSMVD